MRMSRRQGLLGGKKMPLTLEALFSDMVLLGYRAQTASVVSLSTTGFDTSTPYYVFLMRGPRNDLYQLNGTSYSRLNHTHSNTLALTVSDTQISNTNNTYNGGVILAVRFPQYSDTDIETLLGGMAFTPKVTMNSTSGQQASFDASGVDSGAVYISYFTNASGSPRNGMSFSLGSSISTPLHAWYDEDNTQGDTGTKNYAFVYRSGSDIYLSADGTSALTLRNGGIFEMKYTEAT